MELKMARRMRTGNLARYARCAQSRCAPAVIPSPVIMYVTNTAVTPTEGRHRVYTTMSFHCGQSQTINHTVNTCQLTKFEGGLNLLHKANITMTQSYGWNLQRLQHLQNKFDVIHVAQWHKGQGTRLSIYRLQVQ